MSVSAGPGLGDAGGLGDVAGAEGNEGAGE
jgi:hypothetical protein